MFGRRIVYVAVIIAVALTAGLLISNQDSQATTFRPVSGAITLSDYGLGANADVIIPYDIYAPDPNFANAVLTVNSPEFVTSSVSLGKTVGYLMAPTVRLSLVNEGCSDSVPVGFRLVEASTDNSEVNSKPAYGPPADRLLSWIQDDGDINNDGTVDNPSRADNGIADGAEWYPMFLNSLFSNVQPAHRYFGWQLVPGTAVHVTLQIVMFNAGDLLNLPSIPSSELLTAVRGLPSTVILNDPTQALSQGISEFCTPLGTITTLCGKTDSNPETNPLTETPKCDIDADTGEFGHAGGECANAWDDDADGKVNDGCPAVGPAESGAQCDNKTDDDSDGRVNDGCPVVVDPSVVVRTNPDVPGTYYLGTLTQPFRDVDNDGIENLLDPCPYNFDTWDPRLKTTDPAYHDDTDKDGIPNTCDPVNNPTDLDEDDDGWMNRIDTCPLVTNVWEPPTPNKGQQDMDIVNWATPVPDGGPRADNIGPECDLNPTSPDGHYHVGYTIGRRCLAGTDNDNDGVCADYPGENDGNTDTDGDGIPDQVDNCIQRANPNPAGLTQMSPDLLGDGQVLIDDVTYVASKFGRETSEAGYRAAAEVASQNGAILIDDVTAVAGAFGRWC